MWAVIDSRSVPISLHLSVVDHSLARQLVYLLETLPFRR
jgi:hypothetical protein